MRYLDSIHAALVNGWTSCGAGSGEVVGYGAGNWSFGAVGTATSRGFMLKSVAIGAEGEPLEPILRRLDPKAMRKKSSNGDLVEFESWVLTADDLPVVCEPGETATLPAIMLSPLALSVRGMKGRWHDDLTTIGCNLEDAVNFRLSRLTGRNVCLSIEPDQLYLRANPKHSTLVYTRSVRGAKPAFVIGTLCPLSIRGQINDLRSAWALGIGQKNRYGFGCIGYAGK
ncbi:MAG: CRISPR-associated protein Cas6 [Gemmatimonadetes bacterium]|nr:CRISPR-associated protein Cas6 [Gemmatimonadota bacterium]